MVQDLLYYDDIIDTLQDKINTIANELYKNDNCKPKFYVSIIFEEEYNQKIILTIEHLGVKFSRVLFPVKENFYGYENLVDVVKSLYNQTM